MGKAENSDDCQVQVRTDNSESFIQHLREKLRVKEPKLYGAIKGKYLRDIEFKYWDTEPEEFAPLLKTLTNKKPDHEYSVKEYLEAVFLANMAGQPEKCKLAKVIVKDSAYKGKSVQDVPENKLAFVLANK